MTRRRAGHPVRIVPACTENHAVDFETNTDSRVFCKVISRANARVIRVARSRLRPRRAMTISFLERNLVVHFVAFEVRWRFMGHATVSCRRILAIATRIQHDEFAAEALQDDFG